MSLLEIFIILASNAVLSSPRVSHAIKLVELWALEEYQVFDGRILVVLFSRQNTNANQQ